MNRNMFRRIEIAWPVRDPALRQRLIDEAWSPTCSTAGRMDRAVRRQAADPERTGRAHSRR